MGGDCHLRHAAQQLQQVAEVLSLDGGGRHRHAALLQLLHLQHPAADLLPLPVVDLLFKDRRRMNSSPAPPLRRPGGARTTSGPELLVQTFFITSVLHRQPRPTHMHTPTFTHTLTHCFLLEMDSPAPPAGPSPASWTGTLRGRRSSSAAWS